MAFVTPLVEHWLEREITQWVHPMKDRSDDPSHHERTLLPRSYISLLLLYQSKEERKCLFNDAINTFIYGYMVSDIMVKDYSDTTWAINIIYLFIYLLLLFLFFFFSCTKHIFINGYIRSEIVLIRKISGGN